MIGRLDLVIGHGDRPVRRQQHRFPRAAGAVRLGDAIRDGYRAVRIGQQVVREREFVTKRLVVVAAVIAQPDDGGVRLFEVLDSITEPVAFDGSPRGVGFWIPPEQDITAGEVILRNGLSVLVREAEIRRRCPGFNQCHLVCSHIETGRRDCHACFKQRQNARRCQMSRAGFQQVNSLSAFSRRICANDNIR